MAEAHNDQSGHGTGGFREQLISITRMDRGARALTAVILAEIVAAAVLVGLRDVGGPAIHIPGDFGASLPLLHYIVAVCFFLTGLVLIAAGISQSTSMGVAVLFCLLVAAYLALILEPGHSFNFANTALSVASLYLLWTGFVAAALWAVHRRAAVAARIRLPESRAARVVFLAIYGAIGLLLLVTPLVQAFHPADFLLVLLIVRLPMPILFLAAGTDWAEIGDALTRSGAARLGRWPLIATAAVAAAALAAVTLAGADRLGVPAWDGAWPEAAGAVLVAAVAFAGGRQTWAAHFPFASTVVAVGVVIIWREWLVLNAAPPATVDFSLIVIAVGAAFACSLAPRLRRHAPVALLALIAALFFASNGSHIATASLLAAVATVGVALFAAVRSDRVDAGALRMLLYLDGGLVLVWLLFLAYQALLQSGEELVAFDAVFLALSLIWDVLTSAGKTREVQGSWFPQRSRTFLFYGFVALILPVLICFLPMRVEEGSKAADYLEGTHMLLNPDSWVRLGIIEFGNAMVWALFAVRLRNWLAVRPLPWARGKADAAAET